MGRPTRGDMELIEGYFDPEHYWWSRDDELLSGDLLKGIKLRPIHYLFYRGQFMGVEIGLRYSDGYKRLKDRLSAKFGFGENVDADPYGQLEDRTLSAKFGFNEGVAYRGDRARIYLYKSATDTLEIYSTKIQNQIKEDKRLEEEAKKRQEAAFIDFVQDTYGILMDSNPGGLSQNIGDYLGGRISQRDVLGSLDWVRMLAYQDLEYFYGLIKKKEDVGAGGFLESEVEWTMFMFLGARIGAIDYARDMIEAKKIKIGKVTEEFYIATGLATAQHRAYYKALEEVGEKLTLNK